MPVDCLAAVYNTVALHSGKLCPTGWRIPTEQDRLDCEAVVASDGFAGSEVDALKSEVGWSTTQGTDEYGFTPMASGHVTVFGTATGSLPSAIMAMSER